MKRTGFILTLSTGVLLGIALHAGFMGMRTTVYSELDAQAQRFKIILSRVSQYYVEEVDPVGLTDAAIRGMLESLDPHTTYIPEQQYHEIAERFDGHFDGIGIEFIMLNKYPTIISPISKSPAEKLGLLPGDVIEKIDGQMTQGMSDVDVMRLLRGRRGTDVQLSVRRNKGQNLLEYAITRDRIPLSSLLAAFMLDEKTGYVRVTHFAKTTGTELGAALHELKARGMRRLVLDLRGNTGGFLEQAVAVTDKFIPAGKLIVSTRGRLRQANEEFYATDDPEKITAPVIVLINRGTASASEIVAGALQDWDRGLIVGERSFGKGLVQNQLDLRDGSALRVTIARYYTPSGRPIQRPFNMSRAAYFENAIAQVDSGLVADSTAHLYRTESGRLVRGGGGIRPDVPVQWDTASPLVIGLAQKRLFFEFVSTLTEWLGVELPEFNRFAAAYQAPLAMVNAFKKFARQHGFPFSEKQWRRDRNSISSYLSAEVARRRWNSDKYYEVLLRRDRQLREICAYFLRTDLLKRQN